jgi:epoxyqueuosine reductase
MLAYKKFICAAALEAGFTRARILSPFEPVSGTPRASSAKSLLVCALPYGNRHNTCMPPPASVICPGVIAPFARFNYYREAVKRLKNLSLLMRLRYGGEKRDYRIFCNSQIPEKPLALASGLGAAGRNGLVISPEAGSLFVISAMTLPVLLDADLPLKNAVENLPANEVFTLEAGPQAFPLCESCGKTPPCAAACPTGAVLGNGLIDKEKCIQWYASGHGASKFDITEIPEPVLAAWGNRLYGCAACQDACIHNTRSIQGVQTSEGALPEFIDVHRLLKLSDEEIKDMFRGTAMGLSWLGPRAIRRNAEAVLNGGYLPVFLSKKIEYAG